MGKLDLFTEHTPGDWRFMKCHDEAEDIVVGGTCAHEFWLPFSYSKCVESAEAIYSQGLETLFEIRIAQDMVSERKGGSLIEVELTPGLTALFESMTLDAHCQLKVVLKGGEMLFGEMHKLRVSVPLKAREVKQ